LGPRLGKITVGKYNTHYTGITLNNVIIVISVYYYYIRQYAVLNLKQLNSNVQLHCTGSLWEWVCTWQMHAAT